MRNPYVKLTAAGLDAVRERAKEEVKWALRVAREVHPFEAQDRLILVAGLLLDQVERVLDRVDPHDKLPDENQ